MLRGRSTSFRRVRPLLRAPYGNLQLQKLHPYFGVPNLVLGSLGPWDCRTMRANVRFGGWVKTCIPATEPPDPRRVAEGFPKGF